jgi:hypothetical protein
MANVDRPHGFVPYSALLRCRPYGMDGNAVIFINDLVDMEADGFVDVAAAGSASYLGSNLAYKAAAAAAADSADPVLVADHPDQLFEAQDDAGATSAQTHVGNLANHVAGTGNANTKLSGHELGFGDIGTTNNTFVILGLVPRDDNAFGANADLVCAVNTGEGLLNLAAGV